VIAPIAATQQAAQVKQVTNWVQLLGMLFGPQAVMLFARVEELGPEMGRWLRVEVRFIRSQQDVGDMQKMIASVLAAAQQQEGAAAQPEVSPAAGLVNGGAV
jgi:hypothetical protein